MSAISKAIPNFFGGVSQQPSVSRHATQCSSLANGDPSIAEGLGKRAPTDHIASLAAGNTSAFIHWINRDPTQRYVVVITNGAIAVYDLNGVAQTVLTPDGTGYLTSTTPRDEFAAVTVADYTFIVNKNQLVEMTVLTSPGSIVDTVQQFSDLPASPSVGDIYRIEGTPSSTFDDYYVKWDGNVWVETIKPGIQYEFNSNSMPYQLIKTGATQFTFQRATWANRLVGDEASNPAPSFVGQAIQDVFFYRNRLGFLAGENAILSRSGEPFTFWAETVTAVLDSDPIDAGAGTNKVALLKYAVPFNKVLMIFSNTAQFQLSGGEVLTAKTARLDPTTEFEASSTARPASSGSSLFFAVPKEKSTGLREYYVDQDTVSNDAADITAHVPSYIPTGVFRMTCSTVQDLLAVLSTSQRNKVWMYKFYWSGTEKVQSAWHEWEFSSNTTVLGCEFYGSVLYFVLMRGSTVYLEKATLDRSTTDSGLDFRVLLDRKVSLTGTYDSVNNRTSWTLPYSESGDMEVVLGSTFGDDSGTSVNITRPSATTIYATGDYSTGACWVGLKYSLRMRLSTIFLRDDKGVAVVGGSLTLQDVVLWLEDSGYLRAEVTVQGRDKFTYEYPAKTIGSISLAELAIKDALFPFPIMGKNTLVTIDLINDTYLPCNITMAEWDGMYVNRRARS